MGLEFDQLVREWERDVDARAAVLIRQGFSPWVAWNMASKELSRVRKYAILFGLETDGSMEGEKS